MQLNSHLSTQSFTAFCGELQLVDGVANCSGNELGSVCLFSCGEGFSIRGENRSLCEIDGDFAIWNPPVPQCSGEFCVI